jgi:hypothetical protein
VWDAEFYIYGNDIFSSNPFKMEGSSQTHLCVTTTLSNHSMEVKTLHHVNLLVNVNNFDNFSFKNRHFPLTRTCAVRHAMELGLPDKRQEWDILILKNLLIIHLKFKFYWATYIFIY